MHSGQFCLVCWLAFIDRFQGTLPLLPHMLYVLLCVKRTQCFILSYTWVRPICAYSLLFFPSYISCLKQEQLCKCKLCGHLLGTLLQWIPVHFNTPCGIIHLDQCNTQYVQINDVICLSSPSMSLGQQLFIYTLHILVCNIK